MIETPKSVYLNKPQLHAYLVNAPEEYAIWGRGTGKSSGRLAPRIADNVFEMPRSLGIMVADTYQSMLTKTLPGILDGLERLGYVRGRDFFFGQFAPASWKWERPYNCPLKAQYFMHWRNGSGMMLVSQDRANSANGLNIDWIIGDEAKFLNQQRYEEELLPANRGNISRFGHTALHHGILLTSDMPTAEKGLWLLEKQNLFNDSLNQRRYHAVLHLQSEILRMQQGMDSFSELTALKYRSKINTYLKHINQLRMGNPAENIPPLVYYSEANSFANAEILGPGYFTRMSRTLSPIVYKTSILNQRLDSVKLQFYPDLNEDRHGYTDYNNTYLDKIGFDFEQTKNVDCRMDNDLLPNYPLDQALDYGGTFNGLVIGQRYGDEYRFLASQYVVHPHKLKHLAYKFKKYYQYHGRKEVNFYYDHTAKGTNAINDVRYFEEWQRLLEHEDEFGSWRVNLIDVGQTPPHQYRYEMWSRVLSGSDPTLPTFKYNIKNCEQWALSCKLTPMKQGSKGFEKDKAKERRKDYPQEQAPHLSDAGDTLIYGAMKGALRGESEVPFISIRV